MFQILFNFNLLGNHGLYPQETILGNEFKLQGVIYYHPLQETDIHINHILNYQEVYEIIHVEFKKTSKLLEKVLQNIVSHLFTNFPVISKIEISICKNRPIFTQFNGSMEIKLVINRDEYNLSKNNHGI